VLLVLADAEVIRKTLLARPTLKELAGKTVIQMGTIAPAESRAIAERVKRAGGEYIEAPVLGSMTEARSGTLLVLGGATPDRFDAWQHLFRQLSEEPVLVGPVGKAAALKLALNQLIAAETAAFALSLGLVQRHGIDVGLFMKILRKSALYALTFDKKLPRLLERSYKNPNFSAKHMLKDVELILREARARQLNASALRPVRGLLASALRKGWGQGDYCALFEAVSSAPRR
jgi:3-hydroxyisobutyrate dehydrogenase